MTDEESGSFEQPPLPDATDAAVPPAPSPAKRHRTRLIAIAVVALLVVAGGVAAAAAMMPTVSISPQKSLDGMLPATTVGYAAVNLNPTGPTATNLTRIESLFTSQPGWATSPLASEFRFPSEATMAAGGCYPSAEKQIQSELKNLGQQATIALISAQGLHPSSMSNASTSGSMVPAIERDAVVLIPIRTRMTVLQALTSSGVSFASATGSTTHRGVTIYAETVKGCHGSSTPSTPQFYAAEVKNWIIAGLTPTALFRS